MAVTLMNLVGLIPNQQFFLLPGLAEKVGITVKTGRPGFLVSERTKEFQTTTENTLNRDLDSVDHGTVPSTLTY